MRKGKSPYATMGYAHAHLLESPISTKSMLLFLFVLVSFSWPYASGSITQCPGTCRCETDNGKLSVSCRTGFWNIIPLLPEDTGSFWLSNSNVSRLMNGSFSPGYSKLSYVRLSQIRLFSMESGSLQGLPNVTSLNLNQNGLKSLPARAFLNTPILAILAIQHNAFVKVPHESICLARNIESIYFTNNKITQLDLAECFKNLSRLSVLDLSNNPLNHISSTDFQFFPPSMRDLRLAGCGLESLTENVFENLTTIYAINLCDNQLESLPRRLFAEARYLKSVYISGNRLKVFEPTWIVDSVNELNIQNNGIDSLNSSTALHLHNIHNLALDNNRLGELTDFIFTSLGLYNVRMLNLVACHIKIIGVNAFSNLTYLNTLKLSQNAALTAGMIKQAFQNIRFSSLQKLWLDEINLSDLDNKMFFNPIFTNLTELYLDGSAIKELHKGLFTYFTSLTTLSLNNNYIAVIGRDSFSALVVLEKLSLSKNHLVACLVPSYVGLPPTVRTLKLDGNTITKLEPNCASGLDNVESFNMDNNPIDKVSRGTFKGRLMASISLRSNRITSLPNDTYSYMSRLASLNLERNLIQTVQSGCFEALYALEALVLTGNAHLGSQIDKLAVAFRDLFSLNILQLDFIGIQDLPLHTFHSLPNLTELHLSNNFIVNWKPELFMNQNELQILFLANNRIVTLSSKSFFYLVNLREIYLESNPFTCTCDLRWFQGWVTGGSIFANLDVHNKLSYACASPPKQKGTSLMDLDLSFRVCGPVDAVIGGSVGGVMFVIVLVTAALIYRYRWYIRYGVFLFQRRLRQRRNRDDLIPYMFDAFVSYNHRDQRWVIERLLPALEYRGGLKLCLHDRNWIAGQAIAENILESIENSNKTVLIISNAFAQSEWCQLELHMAQHKLLTSRRDVVVMVVLEEPEPEHMTRTLRHLMTTQTYMAWDPDAQDKQRLFWRGLIRAIKNQNIDI